LISTYLSNAIARMPFAGAYHDAAKNYSRRRQLRAEEKKFPGEL